MPNTSSNKIFKYIYFAPALSWGIFISVVTLLPSDNIPKMVKDANDKILHGGIYFFFLFLFYPGFSRFQLRAYISNSSLSIVFLGCVTHGGLIEVFQHYFIRGRTGDWEDFLANNIGALLSVLLILMLRKKE